ncbi:MAG: TIGR01906 family membrane protein [Lachnospiraceae bacterium]|jgi:integral membrane protein (TIGR01906 family)|nr:TIGR01906 family membrane protein [Lachnospiraceae bacterium]
MKNGKKNTLSLVISIIGMLLLLAAILIGSFRITLYGDSNFKWLENEYIKYNVADNLNMTDADRMKVTSHMMRFLIGYEDELSIVINVEGKEQDFFNDQDRFHMGEVRNIFMSGIILGDIALILVVIILVIVGILTINRDNKYVEFITVISKGYFIACGIFFAIVAFIGAAFAIDFSRAFEIFHGLAFDNNLWLFDPNTDFMIRMLPEGLFMDAAFRAGACFLIISGSILIALVVLKLISKRTSSLRTK